MYLYSPWQGSMATYNFYSGVLKFFYENHILYNLIFGLHNFPLQKLGILLFHSFWFIFHKNVNHYN